jgi:hypothetical protein
VEVYFHSFFTSALVGAGRFIAGEKNRYLLNRKPKGCQINDWAQSETLERPKNRKPNNHEGINQVREITKYI